MSGALEGYPEHPMWAGGKGRPGRDKTATKSFPNRAQCSVHLPQSSRLASSAHWRDEGRREAFMIYVTCGPIAQSPWLGQGGVLSGPGVSPGLREATGGGPSTTQPHRAHLRAWPLRLLGPASLPAALDSSGVQDKAPMQGSLETADTHSSPSGGQHVHGPGAGSPVWRRLLTSRTASSHASLGGEGRGPSLHLLRRH